MANARYLLPQHPSLSGPYTKEELYVLVDRGSLARGEIALDRVTKRSHKIGELIEGMPRPRTPEQGTRMDRPLYQEFAGDMPWEIGHAPKGAAEGEEDEGEDAEDEDAEDLDDEDLEGLSLEDDAEGTEHIHYRAHPSWFGFVWGILVGLGFLGAAIALLPKGGTYLLAGVGLASLTFCSVVITRQLQEYYVTDERVEVDWGFIARSSKEIRIVDIRAIDVRQTGLLGFLGVGTLDFSSTASTSVEVSFKNVRRPHRIKELVRQLQRRAGGGGV